MELSVKEVEEAIISKHYLKKYKESNSAMDDYSIALDTVLNLELTARGKNCSTANQLGGKLLLELNRHEALRQLLFDTTPSH